MKEQRHELRLLLNVCDMKTLKTNFMEFPEINFKCRAAFLTIDNVHGFVYLKRTCTIVWSFQVHSAVYIFFPRTHYISLRSDFSAWKTQSLDCVSIFQPKKPKLSFGGKFNALVLVEQAHFRAVIKVFIPETRECSLACLHERLNWRKRPRDSSWNELIEPNQLQKNPTN